jgi:Flp pilus assembly protein TadD
MRRRSSTPQERPQDEPRLSAAPIWDRYAVVMAIVLVILVGAAFAPCLENGFVWDDEPNFLTNPSYRGLGWPQIRWAWDSFLLGVYQPLGWMILEAQYVVFGLNPWGYHFTSLILHALNTVVLFVLTVPLLACCRPGGEPEDSKVCTLGAGLAVALFAVHPLRTEVVAWASCQTYLPCALFYMLAILAYLRAVRERPGPRWGWLAASWFLFAAALLSKAVAVSLPVVLLILDVYPLRRLAGGPRRWLGRDVRNVWWEKVPFLALSLIFVRLALLAKAHETDQLRIQGRGFGTRIAQACYASWFYLIKTVVPTNITAFYPLPERMGLLKPPFLLSLVATLALSVGLFLLRRRWPGLLAVWLSYLVILAPNLDLVRAGIQLAADRYSYVAMTGVTVLVAAGLCRVWQAAGRVRPAALGLAAAGVGAVLSLIVLTRDQCRTWRTTETLWTHALSHGSERGSVPHNNLGMVLMRQGRLDEAKDQCALALRLNPEYADAHGNLGMILSRQGRFDEARAEYAEALRLNPNQASAHINLGVMLLAQGRVEEALAHCEEGVRLKPRNPNAHFNLGVVYFRQGRLAEAAAQYVETLRIDPNNVEALKYLSLVWAAHPEARYRDGRRAVAAASRACELTGWNDPDALGAVAAAYAETGDFAQAVKWQSRAIELARDETKREGLRSRIGLYHAGRPYRLIVEGR